MFFNQICFDKIFSLNLLHISPSTVSIIHICTQMWKRFYFSMLNFFFISRHKQLMHLLSKSQFYSQFLLQKITEHLPEKRAPQVDYSQPSTDEDKENISSQEGDSCLLIFNHYWTQMIHCALKIIVKSVHKE